MRRAKGCYAKPATSSAPGNNRRLGMHKPKFRFRHPSALELSPFLFRSNAPTLIPMLEKQDLPIAEIYVPAKRAKTLEADKVTALAEDILENGQRVPIRVRQGKGRFVLLEGLHRLEALRALGEDQIVAYVAHARLH